jgi:hypothetical protein
MNLLHLLDLSLIGRDGETALEFQAEYFTFGEVDARSNRLARALRARRLRRGCRWI